jgi:hypothetical protein
MISFGSCLIALCAVAAAPQPKTSEVVGVLAVSPPPGPGPELVDLTGKLRDELAKRLDGVLEARDLKERMSSEQVLTSLQDLDRAYTSAVDGAKRDPAFAIIQLRKIIAELERHIGGVDVFDQWTRANLRLARMRLDYAPSPEDGESAAREAWVLVERTIRLQPELMLDASLYPKRLIALVDEARAGLSKAPVRKLVVTSPVAKSKVFVDGKEVGIAPVTLEVPAGVYRVSGLQGALRSQAAAADLRDRDAQVALDFSLSATFRPVQGPGIAAPDSEQESKILQSANALGLDKVVTASLVEQKATYVFASMTPVRSGEGTQPRQGWIRLSPSGLTPDIAPQLAEYLLTGQATGSVTATPPEVDKAAFTTIAALNPRPRERAPEADSIADLQPRGSASPALKWSPAAGVGIAAVLGAIALAELAVGNAHNDDINRVNGDKYTLQTAKVLGDIDANRQSALKAATGFGIGAGVALASSVVLGYLSYRQSHEIGPFRF